jgi:hypothetical protein
LLAIWVLAAVGWRQPRSCTLEAEAMIQTIEGIFRNGKVELLEEPENVREARVIVTFLPDGNGPEGGPLFTPDEVADLRGKLAAWEEDWNAPNAPGMEAYDDYETRRRGSGPVSPQ